jgi:hypothetical protein
MHDCSRVDPNFLSKVTPWSNRWKAVILEPPINEGNEASEKRGKGRAYRSFHQAM